MLRPCSMTSLDIAGLNQSRTSMAAQGQPRLQALLLARRLHQELRPGTAGVLTLTLTVVSGCLRWIFDGIKRRRARFNFGVPAFYRLDDTS